MRLKPNMYQFKSLNYVRAVFLKSLRYFGLGSDRKKRWRDKDDIYAISPNDWDKVLKIVTGDENIDGWKRLFKGLGWIKTSEGKLTIRRRFNGSAPIAVVGIDKERYELLVAMEPVKQPIPTTDKDAKT